MKRVARLLIYVLLTTLIPLSIFLLLPTEVGYQITEQYEFTVEEPEAGVRLGRISALRTPVWIGQMT
jgi:hypothetical protein